MSHPNKQEGATLPLVRCAISTRKSTEEGLEQEFNSLDAQRESAEAFIRSQAHEGWTCLPERYDDGGFTGGSIERPALQRLLAEIAAGKIDLVVYYKVDRRLCKGRQKSLLEALDWTDVCFLAGALPTSV
jgi:site-specific DNA recombinase